MDTNHPDEKLTRTRSEESRVGSYPFFKMVWDRNVQGPLLRCLCALTAWVFCVNAVLPSNDASREACTTSMCRRLFTRMGTTRCESGRRSPADWLHGHQSSRRDAHRQ